MVNDKIQQIQEQLAEITKMDLAEQPEAFSQLHAELDAQLNPGSQESSDQA